MDDDIRDRFGGTKKRSPRPAHERSLRPARSPVRRPATSPSRPGEAPIPREQPHDDLPGVHVSRVYKKRKRSRRPLVVLLVLFLLAGLAAGGYVGYKTIKKPAQSKAELTASQSSPIEATKPTGTVRLVAIGDSLAYESINSTARKPDNSYDYLPIMADFKPFFDKSDIRLCTQATPAGGEALGISGFPVFNAPTGWAVGLANLGCNLVNLGTNHMNDKGQAAIDETLKTWDTQQNILAVSGANRSAAEQAKIRYFSSKGLKFAYLSYTTASQKTDGTTFGVNMYSEGLMKQQVAEAHKNAQLVIVSMNWGEENAADVKPEQEVISQALASQNVDVVIGGGTHVVQPAKILDGSNGHQTLVWFSLGNFVNTELPVDNLFGGMAIMDFDVATQKLNNPKLMPIYMHYEWTAAQKTARTVNARHDFKLYPLDLASEALARSQNGTTVEAQTARITGIITKFAPVVVIKSTEF